MITRQWLQDNNACSSAVKEWDKKIKGTLSIQDTIKILRKNKSRIKKECGENTLRWIEMVYVVVSSLVAKER
jgi:hypothetical protein